jgi:uncharacterized protein (TIGR03066 family)
MLEDNAVFCGKCGASFANDAAAAMGGAQQPFGQPQQPQFNQPQQFGQPQPFGQPAFQGGTAVKQGNNKTVFVIVGIAVAALVVGLILFLFVFKGDYKKDIVGTWTDTTDAMTTMEFKEDGNFVMKHLLSQLKGTYEIDGSTLKLNIKGAGTQEFKISSMNSKEMTLKGTGSDKNTMYKLKKK